MKAELLKDIQSNDFFDEIVSRYHDIQSNHHQCDDDPIVDNPEAFHLISIRVFSVWVSIICKAQKQNDHHRRHCHAYAKFDE